jgi:hypothetical protein
MASPSGKSRSGAISPTTDGPSHNSPAARRAGVTSVAMGYRQREAPAVINLRRRGKRRRRPPVRLSRLLDPDTPRGRG